MLKQRTTRPWGRHAAIALTLIATAGTVAPAMAATTSITPVSRSAAVAKAAAERKAAAKRKAAARRGVIVKRTTVRRGRTAPVRGNTTTTVTAAPPSRDAELTMNTTATPIASARVPVTSTPAPQSDITEPSTATPPPAVTTPATPPTTALPAGAQITGWGGFRFDRLPGGAWRPYSDSSPFNRPLDGTAAHPNSAAMVNRILSWGAPGNMTAGDAGTADDFGHPVYFSQADDPLVALHATENWGANPLEGMRIPVPASARPAAGDDGHLTIVTPDGWEYDLWRAKPPTSRGLSFAWGGRTRVDGSGLNSGGTAAGFGNLAGIIRPEELAAGRIDHALMIVLKCTSNDTSFDHGVQPHRATDLNSSFVFPADHGGARCASSETDAPPMGARLSLAMSNAEIDALAVPAWRKTILRALATYGGYVGDTGGPGFGIQMQSGATYTSFGKEDAAVSYARANNLPTWEGKHVYNVANGVDWARYLRVVVPPAAS